MEVNRHRSANYEIEVRPTIWNVLSADYKDRIKKI